jgi:hypothetical protein
MQLSEQQIASFIALYKAKFGKDLTTTEAHEMGIKLVHLLKTVMLENKRQEIPSIQLEG